MWKRIKTGIILLLVLGGSTALVVSGIGWHRARVDVDAAAKRAEVTAAAIVGLNAAQELSVSDLADTVAQRDEFGAEVDGLKARLVAIGAREPEVRTVVEWHTEEIEVPVDRIITVEVPAECEEFVPPTLRFRIDGQGAEIVTELDNHFAVGVVQLYRTFPLPEELLGSSPWQADVTELFIVPEPEQKRRLRWTLLTGVVLADEASGLGYTGKLHRQLTRRLGAWTGATWSRGKTDSFSCDDYGCTKSVLNSSDLLAEVGLSWSF